VIFVIVELLSMKILLLYFSIFVMTFILINIYDELFYQLLFRLVFCSYISADVPVF